jgi:hypothetical protein
VNFVRVGVDVYNFGLLQHVRLLINPAGGGECPHRIELVFENGSTAAVEGRDALALRAFFLANSASLDALREDLDFATNGEGNLPGSTQGREEGT